MAGRTLPLGRIAAMFLPAILMAPTLTAPTGIASVVPRPVESQYNRMLPFVITAKTRLITDCAATKHLKALFQRGAGMSLDLSLIHI